MNCLEYRKCLQEWLDGQVPGARPEPRDDGAFQEHSSRCKVCREHFASAQRLVEGVKLFARPSIAFDSGRILARVLRDRVERRLRFQRRLRYTVALAASILVMVIVGYIWEPGPKRGEERGQFTKQETPKIVPPPREEAGTPAFEKTLDDATGKVAALTERLADQTVEHARHLLAAAPALPPMGAGVLPEEPVNATASLIKAGKEISEGFEPVTRSARHALDFLMREMSTFEVTGVN